MINMRELVLSTVVGSRMWGMERPDSDTDRFIIYTAPILEILTGQTFNQPEHIQNDTEDNNYIELKVVCDQLIKGNPNYVIGVLSPNIALTTPTGDRLREITRQNLSRNIYPGIRGQVMATLKQINNLTPDHPISIKKCGIMLRMMDFGSRVLKGDTELFGGPIPQEYCTPKNVNDCLEQFDLDYKLSKLRNEPAAADFKMLLLQKRREQVQASHFLQLKHKKLTAEVPGEII